MPMAAFISTMTPGVHIVAPIVITTPENHVRRRRSYYHCAAAIRAYVTYAPRKYDHRSRAEHGCANAEIKPPHNRNVIQK